MLKHVPTDDGHNEGIQHGFIYAECQLLRQSLERFAEPEDRLVLREPDGKRGEDRTGAEGGDERIDLDLDHQETIQRAYEYAGGDRQTDAYGDRPLLAYESPTDHDCRRGHRGADGKVEDTCRQGHEKSEGDDHQDRLLVEDGTVSEPRGPRVGDPHHKNQPTQRIQVNDPDVARMKLVPFER